MSDVKVMKPEANAEIIFTTFAEKPASPISSYGFIVSFESESYSAAVVPNGSGEARLMEPFLVRLQFLVAEAAPFLRSGASFTFFEQGRVGHGRIL